LAGLEPWTKERGTAIIASQATQEGATLPIRRALQETFGHIHCEAAACQSLGADALASHVRERLGVDWRETTIDGTVTLQPVSCLGARMSVVTTRSTNSPPR
jgi:hypothetical protein